MSTVMQRMRMPTCYAELNGCEIEYDGGLSDGIWIGIGIAAALMVGGITMYAIGANMQPVMVKTLITVPLEDFGSRTVEKFVYVASQTSITVENIGLGMFTAGFMVGDVTGLVATW